MNTSCPALSRIKNLTEDKKVLYITTKNSDYLRVQQEIVILRKFASEVSVISSDKQTYVTRLPVIYWKILWHPGDYDVVFIGFAPQLILPLLNWRFFNKTKIIDFFISFYDTIVYDRKLVSDNSFLAYILKKLDQYTLNIPNLIICDTHEHEKYFIEELGAPDKKTSVLYLNADPKYYFPRESVKPDTLKGKFIVLYFGSVLPLQGVDIVIQAANLTQSNDIHFFIIGPVENDHTQNKNITFIDWLPQGDLAKYIAFSDLCLAGHFNGDIQKARRVIPGKAYIYEAMKKRIILGDNPANKERYPSLYNNIIFVEMGDEQSLHKLIQDEYAEYRTRKQ